MSALTVDKQRENSENVYTKLPPSESDGSKPLFQATKLTGMSTDTLSKAKQAVIASRLANMPVHRPKNKSANLPTLSQPEAAKIFNVSGRSESEQRKKELRSESDGSKTRSESEQVKSVKQTDNRFINQITFGNNIDILSEIESNSIDLILTDPPYETALADLYKSWNFRDHDFEFYAEQFDRILNDSGQVAMFCDYITSLAIGNAFQKYFKFRYFYTWIKSNGQPVNKKQPRSNVELVTVWKKQKTLTRDLVFNPVMRPGEPYRKAHKAGNITRKQENDYTTVNETGDRWPEQTLYYPSKDNLPESERTGHPTQKAVNLVGYLIRTLSNEGNLILDPFSGSGSAAIACHRLKRKFICIEQDPEYFIESLGRLERERCQETLPF